MSTLVLSGCDPVDEIDVACSTPALIWTILRANSSHTTTTTLHLDPGCIYEITDQADIFGVPDPDAGLPEITSSIIIDGQDATIRRLNPPGRSSYEFFPLFIVTDSGNLTIHDLSLAGSENWNGGAITNHGTLFINNCDVYENIASRGGAVYNDGTFETLNSEYYDNSSAYGGGAVYNDGTFVTHYSEYYNNSSLFDSAYGGGAVYNEGTMESLDSEFHNNSSEYSGGAIYNSSDEGTGSAGVLNIYGSIFNENSANFNGGALYNSALSEAVIHDSTFHANTAECGGAIYNFGDMELLRSVLYENTALFYGGAVYFGDALLVPGSSMSIINSTLSGNQVTGPSDHSIIGSAVYHRIDNLDVRYTTISQNSGAIAFYRLSGSTTIENSIIAGNPDGDCGGPAISAVDVLGTPNLDSDGSCASFSITAPPLLDPLADNGGNTLTHALQYASPARNAATGDCPAEDQRDYTRPKGPACDLGAFEVFEPTMEEIIIPVPDEPESTESVTPEPEEKEAHEEHPWWWNFEEYVCSDSNLTEMYISTDADPEEFSLTIDDHPVKCYQQSYDNTRYWCHVELVMLDWDKPTTINFCVDDMCQEIQQTTLSQAQCESEEPVEEPEAGETETQTCSSYDNVNSCTAAPGCMWFCANECSCVPEE